MLRAMGKACAWLVGASLLGLGVLYVIEGTAWTHDRAALDYAARRAESWRFDPELGLLPAATTSSELSADAELLWVSDGRWITTETEGDWMRRKLAESGVLNARVRELTLRGASVGQRVRALQLRPGQALVFGVGVRDAFVAHADRRATFELREDRGIAAAPEKNGLPPRPGWLRRLGARIPGIRAKFFGAAREECPLGVFPSSLWPWKREGVSDETQRYRSLRAALLSLAAKCRAAEAPCVILRYPAAFEIEDAELSDVLAELGLDTANFESKRASRRMRDLCEQLALPLVDPRAALRNASRSERCFEGRGLDARPSLRAERIVQAQVARALRRVMR